MTAYPVIVLLLILIGKQYAHETDRRIYRPRLSMECYAPYCIDLVKEFGYKYNFKTYNLH